MKNLYALLVLSTSLLWGQNNIERLEADGLENLVEFTEGNTYYLTYENNRYRFEGDALVVVLETLELPETIQKVSILIQNRGLPMSAVHFDGLLWQEYKTAKIPAATFAERADFTFEVDRLARKFEEKERTNESFKKVDAVVGLSLNYTLGNFDNSIRQKINIQPELQTVFGPGVMLSGRYNIPTFNEIDNTDPYMVLARLTQDFRFKNNNFLSVNAGYFTNDRFGVYSRLDRFIDGERLRVRMDFGVTRMGYLDKDFVIQNNNTNIYNMSGGIIYRWNKYDTDISFRYGTFLATDLGYKARMTRQFNEVYVSLFLNKTTFGRIVGFDFRVPIGPKKHLKPRRLRVRSREQFELIYNYVSDSNVAREFFTGSSVLHQIREYYPEVLRKAVAERLP